jgi:hypothetical protein
LFNFDPESFFSLFFLSFFSFTRDSVRRLVEPTSAGVGFAVGLAVVKVGALVGEGVGLVVKLLVGMGKGMVGAKVGDVVFWVEISETAIVPASVTSTIVS